MEEHPNVQRVRRLYDALAKKDPDLLGAALAPDVVFHVPGRGSVAGEHRGRETILRLFQGLLEQTEGRFTFELQEVLASDSHAVTKHRWSAERKGKRIEQTNFNVYRFNDEGQVIERWEFAEDQAAHDKFWS